MLPHCGRETASVTSKSLVQQEKNSRGTDKQHSPAIVIVAVDVQHLLSLDTEHTRQDTLGQTCAQHNDVVLGGDLVGHGGGYGVVRRESGRAEEVQQGMDGGGERRRRDAKGKRREWRVGSQEVWKCQSRLMNPRSEMMPSRYVGLLGSLMRLPGNWLVESAFRSWRLPWWGNGDLRGWRCPALEPLGGKLNGRDTACDLIGGDGLESCGLGLVSAHYTNAMTFDIGPWSGS
ncbi:hypothetical protein VTJ49DRAFT_6033 [Mycothermus thermophilus]|uniref:Uncharacterized protein n=1 Tax=Humicola insolens TaxID=85995 RepID=A0ABR3V220_HUMIN